jgi:iron complex outermembrane recepter protein
MRLDGALHCRKQETGRHATMPRLKICCALTAIVGALPAVGRDEGIEEIVVTGTYIRRPSQLDAPSPLTVLTADDLAATGANDVGDVIEDLTINTGSQNNPDAFTQNFTTGTSNINLRGLGVSATLVLVNGRRQTQSAAATDRGENFVDTSSLPPMIAFERLEVLKDGATALYGSEAVAGVANFLTRTTFEGFDLEVGMQSTDLYPQDDQQIRGVYGVGNERTHLLVAFDHLNRDMLTTYDRRLSEPGDDVSQAGMPGSFLVPSLPGNPAYRPAWTVAFDGNRNGVADFVEPQLGLPAVPGAQPPVFADQNCTAIAARDPKVIPSIAGTAPSAAGPIPIGLCELDFGSFYSLVPKEERTSAFVQLERRLEAGAEGRLELHVANNAAERNNSPSFPFAAFPTVAASHPDNPYGSDVLFIGRIIGAGGTAVESVHDSDTTRFAASFSSPIGDDWLYEASTQYSENDFFVQAPDVLADRFDPAIRGFGGVSCSSMTGSPGVAPCAYFNPFGSSLTGTGTVNSQELLDWLVGFEHFDAHSELLTLEGYATRRLRGRMAGLRGGPIGIAVGAQYRGEQLYYDYDENADRDNFLFLIGNPDFSDRRDVGASFVELSLPVSETVNVQAAVRYEDYGNGVDSTDPKLTLLWRPSLMLSFRASLGTSFRAPSLFQAFGTQTTLAELIDPAVGSPQFFPVRTQPNPNRAPLQPEGADVLNFGVSFSPTDRLMASLDYWSFAHSDVIVEQDAQALLNAASLGDPLAQGQVIRDPESGLLLRVDSYYTNASSLETDGVDLSVAYRLDLGDGAGSLRFGVDGTYVESYGISDPQAGQVDGAGKRNFGNFGTSTPQWRANAFATWQRGDRHAVNGFVRYVGSYVDDEVELGQGPAFYRLIDRQVTIDAQYALILGHIAASPTLSFGVINLTDEEPPHVATSGGYDSKVHDPRGRLLYAKTIFKF